MPEGLEIFNTKSQKVFSTIDDYLFSIIGSVVGKGTITLPGVSRKYFHLVINTERLMDNMADDFTPKFSVTYNNTFTSVTVVAPAGVTTMIGYY